MKNNFTLPNIIQNIHRDPAAEILSTDMPWRHFSICTPGHKYKNSHRSIVNNCKKTENGPTSIISKINKLNSNIFTKLHILQHK